MSFRTAFTLLSAYLVSQCHAANGPNWGSGPVVATPFNTDGTMNFDMQKAARENFIVVADATLILPPAPNPVVGNTVLWMGCGTRDLPYGKLIQGIANNYPPDNNPDNVCGNLGDRWCIAAFILGNPRNWEGQKAIANAGDRITFRYLYNEETQEYDTYVAINGEVVSTVSAPVGFANGFGMANECTTKPCGHLEAHEWIDITIGMRYPAPDYGKTHGNNLPGVTGEIKTRDGGLTWTSNHIGVPAHDFTTI